MELVYIYKEKIHLHFTYDDTTLNNQGSASDKRWGFSGLKLFAKSRSDDDKQVEEVFITVNGGLVAKLTTNAINTFAIKEPTTDTPWTEVTEANYYLGLYGSTPYAVIQKY